MTITQRFHNGIAREINRKKFVRYWTRKHEYQDIEWVKVRQRDTEALMRIDLKPVEEYVRSKKKKFDEGSLGEIQVKLGTQDVIDFTPWKELF